MHPTGEFVIVAYNGGCVLLQFYIPPPVNVLLYLMLFYVLYGE